MDENSSDQSQPTPVNQPPQGDQTLPTPNTSPQPAQPIQTSFQSQSSAPVASSVVTTQTVTDDQTTGEKKSKLKYLAYFLLGLILSVLGLLIGVIWIVVKEKQNRLRKSIPLLLGVISSIIFWWWVVGGIAFDRTTTSTINTSQPKGVMEREIVTDLSNLYPNLSFKVLYGEHNPPRTFGNTTISTFVTVELSTDGNVTPEQIAEVGKQVCSTLTRLKLSVSQVQVEAVSTKAILSKSQGIGGTCEEYNSGAILNILHSML